MEEGIKNRVSESELITLDLEDFYPEDPIADFDIKEYLFRGMILKEKDFREALKNIDWNNYSNKIVAVHCSADAVVPMWAYMLVASYLQPFAKDLFFGNVEEAQMRLLIKNISRLSINEFEGKKIIIKGCGNKPVKEAAYLEITKILRPVVKSIMYGEACSNVPIFKQK